MEEGPSSFFFKSQQIAKEIINENNANVPNEEAKAKRVKKNLFCVKNICDLYSMYILHCAMRKKNPVKRKA